MTVTASAPPSQTEKSAPAPTSQKSSLSSKVAVFFGCTNGPKKWLLDNHLLVFLATAFVFGLALPQPGIELSKPMISLGDLGDMRLVQFINVVIIFLISGFRLKTDAVIKALKQPAGLMYSWLLILLVTPCLGFAAVRLPLQPREFAYGLALFCCVPTTLTSGAALISGCKGANRASELALLVTISTNLAGVFTTPCFLGLVLQGADVSIDIVNLLVKLALSLLLPTLIGKALQAKIPNGAKISKDYKTSLTIISNFNLVFVVWQSVSRSQSTITSQPAGRIVACIACGVLLHIVFWCINIGMFWAPGVADVHCRRAVFLLSSQKTLPVALAIISSLPEESFGQAGLVALPCIFGHLSQLIIDSFLVDYWAKHPESATDAEVATAELKDVEANVTDPSAQKAAAEDNSTAQPAADIDDADAVVPSAQKPADEEDAVVGSV